MAHTQQFLVTGANRGIGRAITERIVAEHAEAHVYLGARDAARGRAARAEIVDAQPDAATRLDVVELDVSDEASVRAAAARVGRLDGVIHNAGIGRHGHTFERVLDVNARGTWRVGQTLAQTLVDSGRLVIVSSASGPNFVRECSAEKRALLTDPDVSWEALEELMQKAASLEDAAEFAAEGLGDGDAYGLSKAIANAIMQRVAADHPRLRVNACTPGFIATDMTRPYAEARGETPAQMGMKTPHEGARCPLHLLFGELEGNGWYYGSDAQRSPLDRYRAPGDPPFEG